MALQPPASGPKYTYVDLPELSETFADSLVGFIFDGQTLRITFGVNRMDEPSRGQPNTGKRYPACRLVLTLNCVNV